MNKIVIVVKGVYLIESEDSSWENLKGMRYAYRMTELEDYNVFWVKYSVHSMHMFLSEAEDSLKLLPQKERVEDDVNEYRCWLGKRTTKWFIKEICVGDELSFSEEEEDEIWRR